ncbi:MAG: hypothetical protein HYS41_01320 [Candidatus Omnitrophica bacterium]|nr:hypothetical protein [Candidatus Omnitrophota bacterium]
MPDRRPVVLAAAQDAGGANVLIPVIRALQEEASAQVHSLACAQAVGLFERAALTHRVVPQAQEPPNGLTEAIMREVADIRPDLLLLGTAWGQSIDKILLRHTRLPALAVVDHWCYYKERWAAAPSGVPVYPARIALPDETAKAQAIREGLPEEILVVTGHPYLETLVQGLAEPSLLADARSLKQGWLSRAGASANERFFLFAAESFNSDFAPGAPYFRGYTEDQVLEETLSALDEVESAQGLKARLIVKLHPQAQGEFPCGPLARRWRSQGRLWPMANQPPWPSILASDGVLGMTSLLLLEAALAGKRSVSFQPGGCQAGPFIGTDLGLVPTVTERKALVRHLGAWWGPPGPAPAQAGKLFRQAQGAASRIVQELLNLLPAPEGAPR